MHEFFNPFEITDGLTSGKPFSWDDWYKNSYPYTFSYSYPSDYVLHNFTEKDGKYVLKVPIPENMTENEITVEYENPNQNSLSITSQAELITIKGEHKELGHSNSFSYSYSLPSDAALPTMVAELVDSTVIITVDKKESAIKKSYYDGDKELIAVDLPGAYSMSPFTSEESFFPECEVLVSGSTKYQV